MHVFPNLRPLSKAMLVRRLMASGLPATAVGMMLAAPMVAQAQQVAFNIPQQALGSALIAFGQQSQWQLLYSPEQISGLRSSAVKGSLEPDAALRQLLGGTGLGYSVNGTTVTISGRREGGAVELGATNVNAGVLGETTEGTGSYTTGSMSTATKLPTSLRHTPQSVTVLTRQRMNDQNMQTLEDVSLYTPGLTLRKTGGERPTFYSRGTSVDNIMIDGLPVAYDTDTLGTSMLSMFDRVEVVRGASGLMVGAGNPSGTLNLIRKRPTIEPQMSITTSAGSWNNFRTELDASSKLNDSGSVRGRAVVALQDKDSFVDDYSNKRQLMYGITEFDLTEDTTLTLGGYYNREDNPGADWSGLPTYANGNFLPISRSHRMSPSWTYWDKKNKSVFAEIEHHFDNDWKLRLNTTWLRGEMDMLGTSFYRLDQAADTLQLNVGRYTYEHTQKSVDGYVSGPFSLFGRTHELVLGGSYRHDRTDDGPGGGPLGTFDYPVDPLSFDFGSVPKPEIDFNWSRKGKVEQSSTYATVRFNIQDDLKLTLGSRLDWYEYEQQTQSGDFAFGGSSKATREFTPYAGVVYDLNDTYSVYASWTRIFKPQESRSATGSILDPVTGTNYETGIKGEYFGGALNVSLAYFQLNQENLAKALPQSSCPDLSDGCYEAAGEVETKGVELEVQGMLAEGWQASVGYTYAAAKYAKETGTQQKGDRFDSDTPYNLFKVNTVYQLPGDLNQWSIGGGFRTQSRAYTSFGVQQGGYSVTDLMTAYRINKHFTVQGNLNNVFDKRYYQNISNPAGANIFGDPRNFTVTMRWTL